MRAAEPTMLIGVAIRALSRSLSQPPAKVPATAPAPYRPRAAPAWTAEKPRWVRKSTRKICRKPASLLTNTPASTTLAGRGVSRQVALTPSWPALSSAAVPSLIGDPLSLAIQESGPPAPPDTKAGEGTRAWRRSHVVDGSSSGDQVLIMSREVITC